MHQRRPEGSRGEESSAANSCHRFVRVTAGLLLDIPGHHVLAEVVVDDVTAVLVEEPHALLRALFRHQREPLQPRGRLRGIDLLVDVAAGCLVAGIRQLFYKCLDLVEFTHARGIESGGGKEHLLLEIDAFLVRERDRDPVVGRPFGDQRLRREQRVDAELHPATVLHQVFLEQRVVDVVPGVALMAREVHGPVDVDRQIGVYLDDAAESALVPVVAAPRLVGDVLHRETLVGRERDVLLRAFAAGGDCRFETRDPACLSESRTPGGTSRTG